MYFEKLATLPLTKVINQSVLITNKSTAPPASKTDAKTDATVIQLEDLKSKSNTAESIADKVTSVVVVTLGRGGEVWLFNQDKFPVFVSSPTLEGKTESVVLKIEAGHCSRIFDPTLFLQCEKLQQFLPVDPYSINVSLMKGLDQLTNGHVSPAVLAGFKLF